MLKTVSRFVSCPIWAKQYLQVLCAFLSEVQWDMLKRSIAVYPNYTGKSSLRIRNIFLYIALILAVWLFSTHQSPPPQPLSFFQLLGRLVAVGSKPIDWVFVSHSKIHMLKPNSLVRWYYEWGFWEVIRIGWGHEDGFHTWSQCPYESPQKAWFPSLLSTMGGYNEKLALLTTNRALTLMSDFLPPEL